MSSDVVAAKLRPSVPASAGDSLKSLGVAVRKYASGQLRWPHAGVLYRWGKQVRLFHMLTHLDVEDREWTSDKVEWVWAEPAISKVKAQLLAARCRLMAAVQKKEPGAFPYGFRFRETVVGRDGRPKLGPEEIGVTCSTIILAAFAAEGCALVDVTEWPAADRTDQEARQPLIDSVRNRQPLPDGTRGPDPAHADLLQAERDAPRVRPQDVVAAAALYPPARGFDGLVEGAGAVDSRLGL
jgi:hypothetical protein